MRQAMADLSHDILKLQGDGDLDGARKLTNELGVITDELQSDLDRLTEANIPVDITYAQGASILGL